MRHPVNSHPIVLAVVLTAALTALFTFYLTNGITMIVAHELSAIARQAAADPESIDECSAGYASEDESCSEDIEIYLPDPNTPNAI